MSLCPIFVSFSTGSAVVARGETFANRLSRYSPHSIWNIDSDDWCLNEPGSCPGYGPGNLAGLEAELTKWQTGAKSPGVIGLEHESGPGPVSGFVNTYAGIKSNGWDAR